MSSPAIASRQDWLVARQQLACHRRAVRGLAGEKIRDRLLDHLSSVRSRPGVEVEGEYLFDAPEGRLTLAELFGGRPRLLLKHFTMALGQDRPCVGCCLEVDQMAGALGHLEQRGFAYAVVAQAPIEEIDAVRQRMGWEVTFVSSFRSDFGVDVSCVPAAIATERGAYTYGGSGRLDLSGHSIFCRGDCGRILHSCPRSPYPASCADSRPVARWFRAARKPGGSPPVHRRATRATVSRPSGLGGTAWLQLIGRARRRGRDLRSSPSA